jgi:DNA (cytosine-5)-methyltransferase 1
MSQEFCGIDLFCGCGGVTQGFLRAGIDMRLGVDCEPVYKNTYESNNKAPYLSRDIRKVSAGDIVPYLKESAHKKLLISSCAPCQPFSLKNAKRSQDSSVDPRIDLGFELLRIASELESEGHACAGIFIENVPEFSKSPVWQGVREELMKRGFSVAHKVLNFASYGVPQSRRRFIAVAVRGWCFLSMPQPTHGEGLLPYRTVKDAFEGLSQIAAGEACNITPNHRARALSDLNFQRISSVPLNGGSRSSFPEELVLDCHKDFNGHKDVYGRMSMDAPSPTVTTRCISITNGRYGHPLEHRGISVREAARLQTFPDSFLFSGNSIEVDARMIGNAVPVAAAELFGRFLMERIEQLARLSQNNCNNESCQPDNIAA